MRATALLATLVLCACTDLVGPDDPGYDVLCVIEAEEGETVLIPKQVFEACETVEIVIVPKP